MHKYGERIVWFCVNSMRSNYVCIQRVRMCVKFLCVYMHLYIHTHIARESSVCENSSCLLYLCMYIQRLQYDIYSYVHTPPIYAYIQVPQSLHMCMGWVGEKRDGKCVCVHESLSPVLLCIYVYMSKHTLRETMCVNSSL